MTQADGAPRGTRINASGGLTAFTRRILDGSGKFSALNAVKVFFLIIGLFWVAAIVWLP